jgi:hypothetical protein
VTYEPCDVTYEPGLDELRARWEKAVWGGWNVELTTEEAEALLELVDELRRQVKVWKGKAQ